MAFGQVASERVAADESRDDSALEVGVDFAQQDSFMSDLYQKGAYLVYDCERLHWVCTGAEEFNQCAKRSNVTRCPNKRKSTETKFNL